jgi:hypothetical protein
MIFQLYKWLAMPELKRLVAGFKRGSPGSSLGLVKLDLWWTKCHWGRFSPSTSVSLANLQSTKFSIIIIAGAGTIGQSVADLPSGPSWTPPATMRIKKNYINGSKVAAQNGT